MKTGGGSGPGDPAPVRGTPAQRARAAGVAGLAALLARLPAPVVDGLADAVGEVWYRVTPARAAVARGNLAHLAGWLATQGRGSARARAAARDPAALERLVRAAYRHAAWAYAETLRGASSGGLTSGSVVDETPAVTDAAFSRGKSMILVTMHFGSMMAVASVLAERRRIPFTAPMETIDDPELQRVLRRLRETTGVRTVDLVDARRELRAALDRGEGVAIVGDRDVTGGGVAVPLFGLPAPLPMGPAYLAVETGAPVHVSAARRTRDGGFRGWLVTLPQPPPDLSRRQRVEQLLAAEARAFEDLIAPAPEQWAAVFHPIWDDVGPLTRQGAAARRVA